MLFIPTVSLTNAIFACKLYTYFLSNVGEGTKAMYGIQLFHSRRYKTLLFATEDHAVNYGLPITSMPG